MTTEPFIAGREVDDPYFFDREIQICELRRKLASNSPVDVAIVGIRRIGKSSLMKKLARLLTDDGIIAIRIGCETMLPKNPISFAQLLIKHIRNEYAKNNMGDKIKQVIEGVLSKFSKVGASLGESEFYLEIGKDSQKLDMAMDFVFSLLNKLNNLTNKKIVIFLDEFQELYSFGNEFLWALRGYIQHSEASFVVSSSSRRFQQMLSNKDYPFYNFFTNEVVKGVPNNEATDFIKKRLREKNVEIEDTTINKILELSNGRPYYIQLLCSKCYDCLLKLATLKIDVPVFERAFEELLALPPADIINQFSKITGKTKEVFIALCMVNADKSSDLSDALDMTPSAITQLLAQIEGTHGLVDRKDGFFVINDLILREWIKRQYKWEKVNRARLIGNI